MSNESTIQYGVLVTNDNWETYTIDSVYDSIKKAEDRWARVYDDQEYAKTNGIVIPPSLSNEEAIKLLDKKRNADVKIVCREVGEWREAY